MKHHPLKPVLAILFSALALPAVAAPLQFSITELGMFTPTGINNQGQVSGWANTFDGQAAVLWNGSSMTPIAPLAGSSFAYGVNDAGKVVGSYGGQQSRAFSYAANTVDNITPGGGSALAVNNAGQIAGSVEADGSTHAYIYANNKLNDINDGGSGSGSVANALSNNGHVTGVRWDSDLSERHAFIYANGTTTDLSSVVQGYSMGTGINDKGQVIMTVDVGDPNARKSYMYANGIATDLGSLGDGSVYATGINSAGTVVGSAGAFSWPYMTSGFIWQDGAMVNLNSLIDPSLGWTITEAYDINDRNQIAVYGCNLGGDCQALLLTAVPEPETYALLFGGLGLVSWAVRRRQRAA